VLWGSFTVVCRFFASPRSVLALAPMWTLPPLLFNVLRLSVSAAMSVAVLVRSRRRITPRLWAAGAELGFWTLLVNILVVASLARTTAPRVGFFAQLQTLLVPLVSLLLARRSATPTANTPASADAAARIVPYSCLALVGSALLSVDRGSAVPGAPLVSAGDGLAVLSSVFSTVYVLRSRAFVVGARLPGLELTAIKTVAQATWAAVHLAVTARAAGAGAAAAAAALRGAGAGALALNAALVLYAGIGVSFCGALLQISSLAYVSASDAALIFAFAPVVTAALAAFFMGEFLGAVGIAGAALILASCVATTVSGERERRRKAG
jgi:drug/metabolite transporter (DMT)-like permease